MWGRDQQDFFEAALFQSFGKEIQVYEANVKSGGCINNAVQLVTSSGSFFMKWNQGLHPDLYPCEMEGLNYLRSGLEVKAPEPLHCGEAKGKRYLIMEYLDSAKQSPNYWEDLAISLASLHKVDQSRFGLDHDNFIGSLHQKNQLSPAEVNLSWIEFFIQKRLAAQLELAYHQNKVDASVLKKFDVLYKHLPELLTESKPHLLHGDLWGGNVMTGPGGFAYFIDPAVYFGHPECDLGFTRLFGGFDEVFYSCYNELNPFPPGQKERLELYNLYPLLVHVNLFGTGYLSGVLRVLDRYC